jgi:hypothetical protein
MFYLSRSVPELHKALEAKSQKSKFDRHHGDQTVSQLFQTSENSSAKPSFFVH